jgi:hypothetical protein
LNTGVIGEPFLLSTSQKTSQVQYCRCLLYPDVSPDYVTAFAHGSYISQKMAAVYKNIFHSFLDAIMMYVACYKTLI